MYKKVHQPLSAEGPKIKIRKLLLKNLQTDFYWLIF